MAASRSLFSHVVKILHVEGGRNFYGGAHQILLLMQGLKARGIINQLACRPGSELAAASSPYAEVYPTSMAGDLDVGLIFRLLSLIRSARPDLVHLHSRIGADVMGGIACRLTGVPVVHSRRLDNPESRVAVALKYRLHDRVIAISDAIGQILLEEGLPSQKLRCVRDAIEIPPRVEIPDRAWFNDTFKVPEEGLALGVIAQLIQRKGHQVLLEALPPIVARWPGVRLFFFGKGPMEAVLRDEIAQRGLGQQVQMVGFREDLDRILPCLDLVIHPALREGMGVSLLQASAAEVPIVASAVGGIPEAVRDGETGLLVAPNQPQALSLAMASLLEDPMRRRTMGRAGRSWVERAFCADLMVEGNLEVYQELLKSS